MEKPEPRRPVLGRSIGGRTSGSPSGRPSSRRGTSGTVPASARLRLSHLVVFRGCFPRLGEGEDSRGRFWLSVARNPGRRISSHTAYNQFFIFLTPHANGFVTMHGERSNGTGRARSATSALKVMHDTVCSVAPTASRMLIANAVEGTIGNSYR